MIEGRLPPSRDQVGFNLAQERQLAKSWTALRKHAKQTAVLPEPDFIVLPWMNDWADKRGHGGIDLERQNMAAELLARSALESKPTHVVAIGSSGLPLGKAVHEKLRTLSDDPIQYSEILKVDGGMNVPHRNFFMFEARSYTEKQPRQFLLEDLQPVNGTDEVRVLLIDDVAALGQVSLAAITALQSRGVRVVYYGSYLSKDYQGGLQKIADHARCPAQAVIRVAEASDSRLVLTPPSVAAYPMFPSYSLEMASHANPTVASPWKFPKD